jgi:hypothetical protein
MLRILIVIVIILAIVAFVTRAPGLRRALIAICVAAVIYTILKLTGVIEAMAPDRIGVF